MNGSTLGDFNASTESSEILVDGCSLTHDYRARAGYAHTNPNPDIFAVARTVDLGAGVAIDLDGEGMVRGVEKLGEPIHFGDLLRVLRHCRWVDQ